MNNLVQFNNHNLEVINKNGQRYFSAPQIGAALGYSRSDQIIKIYNAHKDEFTNNMSETAETALSGNLTTTTRIFSLRGCHLLAMFSRTPVAKEFRRWVLDLIEQQNQSVTNCQQLDAKTIGGIVKRCAVSAFREAIMDIMTAAEQPNFFGEVKDDDLIRAIWGWYAGHHKKTFKAMREISAENDKLKCKLATIKKAVA